MIKRSILLLLAVAVLIQFIRPAPNRSAGIAADDLTRHFGVPDSVRHILQRSCNDCHSNNTIYPWYDRIQPVAWWLNNHIKHGKHSLNFSIFASYPKSRQIKKLKAISSQVREGGMPLDSYLWIHKDAILNPDEKTELIQWADALRDSLVKAL